MESLDQATTLLRRVPLFEGLAPEDLQELAAEMEEVTGEAGEVLFQEGDEGDRFFVVVEGAVEISRAGRGGTVEKLAVRRQGEAFGEMALLDDAPRSASARLVETARLLVLDRESFRSFLDPDSAAFGMLVSLSKALRALDVRFTARQNQASAGDGVRDFNRLLQRGLLPRNVPAIEGYEFAAGTPRIEGAVGATVWDLVDLDGEAKLLAVLEVEGRDFPPAHTLALTRSLLRAFSESGSAPGRLLGLVNDALVDGAVEGVHQSVACGLLQVGGSAVHWAAAGKIPGVQLPEGGGVDLLPSSGPPLGVLPEFRYGTRELTLQVGESVAVFSSGSEGLVRGAGDLIRRLQHQSAEDVVGTLHRAVERARPGVETSITLLRKC